MNNAPHLDFLTRLKNAYLAHNSTVVAPSSKLIVSMAELLKRFHLLADYKITDGQITAELVYPGGLPAFTNVRMFSTPGRRYYQKVFSLPWGKTPNSLIIISTPQGLMSQKEAKIKGIGGEIFAELY